MELIFLELEDQLRGGDKDQWSESGSTQPITLLWFGLKFGLVIAPTTPTLKQFRNRWRTICSTSRWFIRSPTYMFRRTLLPHVDSALRGGITAVPDVADRLQHVYVDGGRWEEAEKLQVLVVEMSKRVLGNEHLSTLTSMGNLALTYWNQGRWKEAEVWCRFLWWRRSGP